MTKEEISEVIYLTWTTDPNSGLADLGEFPVAAARLRATCDAVAEGIVQGGGEPTTRTSAREVFTDLQASFTLAHAPVAATVKPFINGILVEDFTLAGAVITVPELQGTDKLVVYYDWEAPTA